MHPCLTALCRACYSLLRLSPLTAAATTRHFVSSSNPLLVMSSEPVAKSARVEGALVGKRVSALGCHALCRTTSFLFFFDLSFLSLSPYVFIFSGTFPRLSQIGVLVEFSYEDLEVRAWTTWQGQMDGEARKERIEHQGCRS